MPLKRPHLIIRSAAVLTGTLSLAGIITVGRFAFLAMVQADGFNYRHLIMCAAFAMVPILLVRESIRSWHFIPKAIESIYSSYLLFGFLGLGMGILQWSHSDNTENFLTTGISLSLFIIGVLVAANLRAAVKEKSF